MSRPAVLIILLVAVALLAGASWLGADRWYVAPRDARLKKINDARDTLERVQRTLRSSTVNTDIDAFADRTLGGDEETVDHQFRTRLNRIAEEIGLRGPAVGTGGRRTLRSPARTAFPRSGVWRELRDEPDFVELDGWISGEGSLEQIALLGARIDAEPWMKRVDSVKLDAKDNGARFAVTIRMTTLYLPGREPDPDAVQCTEAAVGPKLVAFVQRNPFRIPPKPAPPPVAVSTPPNPDPPPAAPTFPWQAWAISGIAEGPDGSEVWMRNLRTGETRRMIIGDTIGGAVLIDAPAEWAEFELNGTRFRVRLGSPLSDRFSPTG